MTLDPLDILLGGTNPQDHVVDLTNHPVIQRALEASYRQEDQVAFGQWFVGALQRGLALLPGGAVASHILVGSELPATTTPEETSQAQGLLSQLGISCSGGASCPPIVPLLQQVVGNAPPALRNLVGLLASRQ